MVTFRSFAQFAILQPTSPSYSIKVRESHLNSQWVFTISFSGESYYGDGGAFFCTANNSQLHEFKSPPKPCRVFLTVALRFSFFKILEIHSVTWWCRGFSWIGWTNDWIMLCLYPWKSEICSSRGMNHVASFLFFARIGGGVGHAAWVADGGNNPRIAPSVEDTSTDKWCDFHRDIWFSLRFF